MQILSFDVGIRHLAYALITIPSSACREVSALTIDEWDVIDLQTVTSVEACCRKLTDELATRFGRRFFDLVLVERQPKHRSIMMVAIQMFLCAYFHAARATLKAEDGTGRETAVKFVHARMKLDLGEGDGDVASKTKTQIKVARPKLTKQALAERYRENKRYSIARTRHILSDILHDYANLALLELYPKKDDLCDAFLQAVAYLRLSGGCIGVEKNRGHNVE